MNKSIFHRLRQKTDQQLYQLAVLLVWFFTTLWLGYSIGHDLLSIERLFVIVVVPLLMPLFLNPKYGTTILLLSMAGLILGWRGIQLVQNITFYVSEIIIWIAFFAYVLRRSTMTVTVNKDNLDSKVVWLVFFSFYGVLVAFLRYANIALVIEQLKSFLVFFPLTVLFSFWVNSLSKVRRFTNALVWIGFFIALLGIVERYIPFFSATFPKLFYKPVLVRSNFLLGGDIQLAHFSAWGTPVVTVFLVPLVGLWSIPFDHISEVRRWLWRVVGVLLISGIIVGGYRSAWIGLLVTLSTLLFARQQRGWWLAFSLATIMFLLPHEFLNRVQTIFLLNRSGDSSIIQRTQSAAEALRVIAANPVLGLGWGASTFFNDWFNLAVALGLPGLAVFVLWYLRLIRSLMDILRHSQLADVQNCQSTAAGFMAALSGLAVCLTSGAFTQILPLMTAFWLVFCLARRFSQLAKEEFLPESKFESVIENKGRMHFQRHLIWSRQRSREEIIYREKK